MKIKEMTMKKGGRTMKNESIIFKKEEESNSRKDGYSFDCRVPKSKSLLENERLLEFIVKTGLKSDSMLFEISSEHLYGMCKEILKQDTILETLLGIIRSDDGKMMLSDREPLDIKYHTDMVPKDWHLELSRDTNVAEVCAKLNLKSMSGSIRLEQGEGESTYISCSEFIADIIRLLYREGYSIEAVIFCLTRLWYNESSKVLASQGLNRDKVKNAIYKVISPWIEAQELVKKGYCYSISQQGCNIPEKWISELLSYEYDNVAHCERFSDPTRIMDRDIVCPTISYSICHYFEIEAITPEATVEKIQKDLKELVDNYSMEKLKEEYNRNKESTETSYLEEEEILNHIPNSIKMSMGRDEAIKWYKENK